MPKYQAAYITMTDNNNKTWGEYIGMLSSPVKSKPTTWSNSLFYALDINIEPQNVSN